MSYSISLIPSLLTNPILNRQIDAPILQQLSLTAAQSVDGNSRAMLSGSQDIGEMSLATLIWAVHSGKDFRALPIFTGRRFVHSGIALSPNLPSLENLPGHRVALPQFWMTSSVWHRGLLADMYSIPATAMSWTTTAPERLPNPRSSTGRKWEICPDGSDPWELLLAERVEAVLMPRPIAPNAHAQSPFADVGQAEISYWETFRVFPIMHLIVLQGSICRQDPDIVQALYELFEEAKRLAFQSETPTSPFSGIPWQTARTLMAGDPWEYGWEANRATLQQFWHFLQNDGLIAPDLRWEDSPAWLMR